MPKRPPKKRAPEQLAPDSDEHFAHIAGYTAGGAPYGVTWEEMEALERREAAARSITPPPQMEPVPLNEIAQEMQMVSDTMTVYFKCTTGEFVAVTDEYVYAAEDDDPLDGRPEWEQEAVRTIADFLAHEDDGTYVPLPSRYDIHEYAIMERFCETITNKKIANDLFRAISGKGAFRRFKDAIHRHGIQENWYRFKDYAYREIAREWCEEHGLTWRE